jgi:hypothetical protein
MGVIIIHSLIHLSNMHHLEYGTTTCHIPGLEPGSGDTTVNKIDQDSCPLGQYIPKRMTDSKSNK